MGMRVDVYVLFVIVFAGFFFVCSVYGCFVVGG